MAPLPSNNTGVLFIDYETCGINHTLQARFDGVQSFNDSMALLDGFLTALDPAMYQINILGARVRDQGGNVTYPVTWTGAASYGNAPGPKQAGAWYFDFIGRSIGGRRCRIEVFGAPVVADETGEDYRLPAATSYIGAALAALESDGGAVCAIDGDAVNWHQYANTGVNAYWRNRIR